MVVWLSLKTMKKSTHIIFYIELFRSCIKYSDTWRTIFTHTHTHTARTRWFCGDVVLDSFKITSNDENSILYQYIKSKYGGIFITMLLIFIVITWKYILTCEENSNPIFQVTCCRVLFFVRYEFSSFIFKNINIIKYS